MDQRSGTASSHFFEDIWLPAEVFEATYSVIWLPSGSYFFIHGCRLHFFSRCYIDYSLFNYTWKKYRLIFICVSSNSLATFIGQIQTGFWKPHSMPDHQSECRSVTLSFWTKLTSLELPLNHGSGYMAKFGPFRCASQVTRNCGLYHLYHDYAQLLCQ